MFPFSKSQASGKNWIQLESESRLQECYTSSGDGSKLIASVLFKHSTRCSVSRMVLSRLEEKWSLSDQEFPFYFLDLLAFRQISNQIATDLGVRHESPQLLIIRQGQCIYSQTHTSISVEETEAFLRSLKASV